METLQTFTSKRRSNKETSKRTKKTSTSQESPQDAGEEAVAGASAQPSQANPPPTPPNWNPTLFNIRGDNGNTFLFRDHKAFTIFEGYASRKLCDPYFYKKLGSLPGWEKKRIEDYIDHWGMRGLVECNEPYHETIVKAFYANLLPLENEYGYETYIGGQQIMVTPSSISSALNLPNDAELEEIYVTHGSWPKAPEQTWAQYRAWFNKDIFVDFYATELPAVHRLAFLFINNILTPKRDLKTNIQYGNLFFLRHLIGLTSRKFHIPFIILSHMAACLRHMKASLPYAHVIHQLLKHQGVDTHALSMLTQPNVPFTRPENLWNDMPKYAGWVKDGNKLIPGNHAKNDWIRHPQATPNQYTDPALPPPASQPVPGSSSSSVPVPTSFNEFARATWDRFDRIELQNKEIIGNQKQLHDTVMKMADNQRNFVENLDWVKANQRNLYTICQEMNTRTKTVYDDAHAVAVGWVSRYGSGATQGEPSNPPEGSEMDLDPSA